MMKRLFDMARPLVMALEPERAHEASLRALELGAFPRSSRPDDPALHQSVFGLSFPNPIGIAAGYDKDARVPDALLSAGMGFAEIGTVTPLPQAGNPKPRVFRLPESTAVINRLGFNNAGHTAAHQRLETRAGNRVGGIVGVNIGANKDATDRNADYVAGIHLFDAHASYFTVNISSPNTPGLRDLQAPELLGQLLSDVMEARDHCAQKSGSSTPVVVKLAPDVAADDVPAIIDCLHDHKADAICISNTTLTRPNLKGARDAATAKEAGGLSGAPLFDLSTTMLARVYRMTGGSIPLIGVGGIHSPETAVSKIEAGATLIQLYTGLIYGGPPLIEDMKKGLVDAVARQDLDNVSALVGTRAHDWPETETH